MIDRVLSEQAEGALTAACSAAPPSMQGNLSELARELPLITARWAARVGTSRAVRYLENYLPRRVPELGDFDRSDLRRVLIARLALTVPGRLKREDLPDSILGLIPERLDLLAAYLSRGSEEPYGPPGDDYLKDLKFVLLLSVPCGSSDLDLAARVPLSSVIASTFRSGDLSTSFRYLSSRGYGTWLRVHTDSRYLSQFNEVGRELCYRRVAEILLRRKHVRGLAGTSWYLDPSLQDISPHLAYLQRNPTRRGAFLLRHGTNPLDIDLATRTSRTRRRLYEAGEYTPVCYSFVWPRNAILSWAAGQDV
jgi:hypothetical protein